MRILELMAKAAAKNSKNNNKILIIVGVVALLAAAGYFLMGRGGGNPLSNTSSPADLVTNALTGSGSMKCEYTDEDGRVVTAYVKGGKMRADVTGGQEGNGSMIFKDNTSWTWDNTTKQGMMYKAPEVTGTEEAPESDTTAQSDEEIKAEIEQYKDNCKNESVSDALFEPPSDVTFQDFSQMMQQMPQGGQVPAEYQQYMEQQ